MTWNFKTNPGGNATRAFAPHEAKWQIQPANEDAEVTREFPGLDADTSLDERLDRVLAPVEDVPAREDLEIEPNTNGYISTLADLDLPAVEPRRSQLGPIKTEHPPLIDDRYRVRGVLGSGATATVYRVCDPDGGPDQALKLLHAHASTPEQEARFEREQAMLLHLDHRNIARSYSSGSWDGRLYFTMELLDGMELEDRITSREPMAVSAVVAVIREAASALAAAHDEGIIHRDIKPANILLIDGGAQVKVVDFGLARTVASGSSMTAVGELVGTPRYTAPERMREAARPDPAWDIYALGVVAFEALTGRPLHGGRSLGELLMSIQRFKPTPPSSERPGVPVELDRLVMRMLAQDPGLRPTADNIVWRLSQLSH